jgi:hypothetical protein
MGTAKKGAPKTPIMSHWAKTEAEQKEAKLQRNLKMLKTKGNEHIITLQGKADDAEVAYNDAIMSSKKTPNFASIAKAEIAKKASELELAKAIETYETIFGESPSIA